MEKWKLERNSQREVDALPGDDCRELADEAVEGVAGGYDYEKASFRCRDCHNVFFAPSTFLHYICPDCHGPSDKVG